MDLILFTKFCKDVDYNKGLINTYCLLNYAKEVIKTLSEKEMQSMIDSKAEFYLVAKSKSKFNAEAKPLMETEVGDWALWHFRAPAR